MLKGKLRERLAAYPAVALLGPRQSGKTTLARALGGRYYDCEQDGDRLRLDVEWDECIRGRALVVLDEAQNAPEIFPRLRSAIDADRKRNGRFLLLGSVSPALMTNVGESLTGRLALCELSPLIMEELPAARRANLWKFGGYPDGGVLNPERFPDWQKNYLALLSQRDLPSWGLPSRPKMTSRLFSMLAGCHGQLWNASEIGKSLGLSYHTVNTYVDFLEQSFLVRRLPAYAANIRKRLIKAPKFYWRDTGLLHALLDVERDTDIFARRWVGASWEGWVIEQILSHLAAAGKSFHAFHLRTGDKKEIDLLLEYAGRLWVCEVKLTGSPSVGDLEALKSTGLEVKADRFLLISRALRSAKGPDTFSVDLPAAINLLLAA